VQVASEIGAELLIIGTHSKRSRWNSVLGGIAVQLQKYAPCPVILVSPPRGIGAVDERGGVGEQACQNRTRHAEDAAIVRVGSGIDTTEGLRLGCACTQGPRYIAANG
jgi:hypothetical protein